MAGRQLGHLARAHDHDLLAGEGAEDLARQLDGRVAHRDGALANAGFRAHALGDSKGAGKDSLEQAAESALGFGDGVGGLELAEDLRLAQDHGIQAGGHAEQVMNGLVAGEMVEVWGDRLERLLPAVAEEAADIRGRVNPVIRRDRDLDAVAGRKDQALEDAGAGAQIGQRGGERGVVEGQPLAHFDRRGLVVHARDQEYHRLSRLRRPVCAAQVRAEQPSSARTISAALRPLHPADTRIKTTSR